MTSRSKINHLDRRRLQVLQQDVLRFEIAMDDAGLVQHTEGIQKLGCKDANQTHSQSAELVLFDKLIQIDRQQLKHKTEVPPVNKCVLQPQNVVSVVDIVPLVQ